MVDRMFPVALVTLRDARASLTLRGSTTRPDSEEGALIQSATSETHKFVSICVAPTTNVLEAVSKSWSCQFHAPPAGLYLTGSTSEPAGATSRYVHVD